MDFGDLIGCFGCLFMVGMAVTAMLFLIGFFRVGLQFTLGW